MARMIMDPQKTPILHIPDIRKKWYVVDAKNKTLGRLATRIALAIRGKTKAVFTPNVDCGDFVIVVNAEQIRLTGAKSAKKVYGWHTHYPKGLRLTSFTKMQQEHPTRVIEWAVNGMLPKGPLGRRMRKKLFIYAGPEHPHSAQQPLPLPGVR